MRRGNPAAVSYHYKPAKAGEMGENMLYRLSNQNGEIVAESARECAEIVIDAMSNDEIAAAFCAIQEGR